MTDKRLDAWIPEEYKTYLAERTEKESTPMNQLVANLIRDEMARQQGAIIEQQSLPIIREIVSTELRKLRAELRAEIREDMALEFTNEFKAVQRASDNRLAALIVRCCS
jgi:hypothetical protein